MAKRLRDVCALPESECSGAPDAASSQRDNWKLARHIVSGATQNKIMS
jgi:hypothetical protein